MQTLVGLIGREPDMAGAKQRELLFQLEGHKQKLEELRKDENGELKHRGSRGALAAEQLLAKLVQKNFSPTDVHSPSAFGLSLRVPDSAVHALSASVLSSRDSPYDDSSEVLALKQQLEEAKKAAAEEKRKNKAAAEARNAEEVQNLKAKASQAKAEASQAKAELEAVRAAAAKDLATAIAAALAAAKAAAPVPIAPEPAQPQVGRNISLAEDLVAQETARRTAVCQLFTLSICD